MLLHLVALLVDDDFALAGGQLAQTAVFVGFAAALAVFAQVVDGGAQAVGQAQP